MAFAIYHAQAVKYHIIKSLMGAEVIMSEYTVEPERKIPVVMKGEVVIIGGGPAGVGAALGAARNGADTVLIERFGTLGGEIVVGFMNVGVLRGKGLNQEIFARLERLGYASHYKDVYSGAYDNLLTHLGQTKLFGGEFRFTREDESMILNSEMAQCIINDMMEENGIKLLLNTMFVDTLVGNGTIKAVIVENVSGRQAIQGKIYVDATATAAVAVKSGVPYTQRSDEQGLLPQVMGLQCKASGVDFKTLYEYQKEDPLLDKAMEKAMVGGELPSLYKPKRSYSYGTDGLYTGHPRLEMGPGQFPGEMLLWIHAPYEENLRVEKAEDVTRAEIQCRKLLVQEMTFLRKYVPGFEKAYISGIPPYVGTRESRHPEGEYIFDYPQDVGRKFDDAVYVQRRGDREQYLPYRCLLPKKIDNLLLAGHSIAANHRVGTFSSFGGAMDTGQVAGTAAALSVKNKVDPKKLKYPLLKAALIEQGLLTQ
jgi:hypothetical protein